MTLLLIRFNHVIFSMANIGEYSRVNITAEACSYSVRREPSLGFNSGSFFSVGSRCCAHASPRARNISLSLGTKVELLSSTVDFEDSRKGWILMFFGISRFIFSPPPHTLYKHIVAVKVTIDKQSPHAKWLVKSGGGVIFETGSACSLNGDIMVDPFTL